MKTIFIAGGVSYNSIINLDEFPKPEPKTIHHCKFKETVGNTGAGKAVTLSKLGFNVTFHSVISNDSYGKNITKYLNQPRLNFIPDIDDNGTERHLNIMNKKGERISIFMNPASDNPIIDYSKFHDYIKSADYVVINISNYCRNLLDICKEYDIPIWTDLHDYDIGNPYHQDFVEAADYIFLSSDNLKGYRGFMQEQIRAGKKLVVCTHAKKGATALTENGEWIETPIINSYKMKDANGAGDAFFSGFLYGFSKNYATEKNMQMATISAGLCIGSEHIASEQLTSIFLEKEYNKYYNN